MGRMVLRDAISKKTTLQATDFSAVHPTLALAISEISKVSRASYQDGRAPPQQSHLVPFYEGCAKSNEKMVITQILFHRFSFCKRFTLASCMR